MPTAEALRAAKAGRGTEAEGGGTAGGTMRTAEAVNDPVFVRFPLSVNGTASAGTQFVAADFDQDGDIDLASAGKLGVHLLENLQVTKVQKEVRERMQPLERKWPFPGEGREVPQEEGPVPKE